MQKQKKHVLTLVLVPMIMLSPFAVAGDDDGKWYAGIGLGLSRLEPDRNGSIYSVSDNSSSGFKMTLGYDFSENISFEGYYSDLGEATMSPNGEISYKDLGASGLYYFYQQHDERHKGWEAFIKAGLGWMKNDTELVYERVHNSHVMFGLGGGYDFGNGLALRADIDLYDEDSQFIVLSVFKRFGGEKRAQSTASLEPVSIEADSDGDSVMDSSDRYKNRHLELYLVSK